MHPMLSGLTLSLLLAGCASTNTANTADLPPTQSGTAAHWQADVQAMADAADNAGRRAHIKSQLETLGMSVETRPFAIKDKRGENLLATVSGPADAPLLLIGAHSDRVEVGRGATDNASGSAAVLALAERFKRSPLKRHRVAVAFWDLEELGLLGSQAYIADGGAKPALYVNFDVFGWGDSLWMMSPDADSPLVQASRKAARDAGLQITTGDKYPPTDHLAFLKAKWPAVSYSLVDASEIPGILEAFSGKHPEPAPKVMAVIHSDGDTMDKLEAGDVATGIDAVEAALRAWDAR